MEKYYKKLLFLSLILPIITSIDRACIKGEIKVFQSCVKCETLENVRLEDANSQVWERNVCPCKQGYLWSPSRFKCQLQLAPRKSVLSSPEYRPFIHQQKQADQEVRSLAAQTCDTARGFILYGQGTNSTCINCRVLPYALGVALTPTKCACTSSFNWVRNLCFCSYPNYVDAAASTCTPCSSLESSLISAYNTCTFPFIKSAFGCIKCSTLNNNGGNTTCCAPGYSLDFTLGICKCSGKGMAAYYQLCIACSSTDYDCLSCRNSYIFDGYMCNYGGKLNNFATYPPGPYSCQLGYTFKNDPYSNQIISCACSAAALYYQDSYYCIACSSTLPKNVTLANCQKCVASSGFYRGSVECIYCPGAENAVGTASVSGCICLPNYYWNTNTDKCECDFTLGYIGGSTSNCIYCPSIPNTAQFSTKTACSCVRGYFWNANTNTCECDVSSPYVFLRTGQCIDCFTMIGSSGTVEQDGLSCDCIGSYFWNYGLNQCQCDSGQNFVILPDGFCGDCANDPMSSGLGYNQQCVCLSGFVWSTTSHNCTCPSGMALNYGKCTSCASFPLTNGVSINDCSSCNNAKGFASQNGICVLCVSQRGVIGNTLNGECSCPTGQIWNAILGGCVCDWGKFYVTSITANGSYQCVQCPYTLPNLECACGLNILYHSSSQKICSDCTQDPNSIIDSNKKCVCKSGYSWSELQYPFRCFPSYSGGFYMYLSSGWTTYSLCLALNTTQQTYCLNCDNSKGYLLMAGLNQCFYCKSVAFATGYAFINACECQVGYHWDPTTYLCQKITCASGYIYNYVTSTCNICDSIRSIFVSNRCISCSADLNSNGHAANSTACSCKATFVWSSSACIAATCNTSTSIWIGGVCFKCPSTQYGTGVAVNTSRCGCSNGYAWQTSANGTSGQCACNRLVNYIGLGIICTRCPIDANSTGISDGLGSCLCKNNFLWDYVGSCLCDMSMWSIYGFVTANGTCFLCSLSADPYFDGSVVNGVCRCAHGFVAVQTSSGGVSCQCPSPGVKVSGYCITCRNNTNTTNKFNSDGICICRSNFIWSSFQNNCICDSSVSAYITPNGTCFQCTNDPNFSGYLVDGACQCINGWTYVSTGNGGSCKCNFMTSVLLQNGSCLLCPNSNTSDGNGGCLCQNNYVWSVKDVPGCYCDATVSSYLRGNGTCFQCTIKNDPNFDGTLVNGTCNCKNNFTLALNSSVPICTCLYPNQTCIICPISKNSLGASDGKGGCLCLNKFVWDKKTANCVCNSSTSIVLPNGTCLICGLSGTYTSKVSNISACTCASTTLFWNSAFGICDCGPKAAFTITGNTFKCITCTATVNSNGSRIDPYNCACRSNIITWNNVTRQCDCGNQALYSNGSCIPCDISTFSLGLNLAKPNTCTCNIPKSTWNPSYSKCACTDNKSVYFVNYYGDYDYACQVCNSSIFALAIRLSPTDCACPNNSNWYYNVGCICDNSKAAAYVRGTVLVCVVCNSVIFSAGPTSDGKNCTCLGALSWNSTSLSCGCSSGAVIASLGGRYFCSPCNSSNWAKIPLISPTKCTCVSASLIWYDEGYCGCANSSVTVIVGSASNITCVTCNASINSIGKSSPSSNVCLCVSPVLTYNKGVCDCGAGFAYTLQGVSVYTCVNCNNSTFYLKSKASPSSCLCISPILAWDSKLGVCRCANASQIVVASGTNYSCLACVGQYTLIPRGISSCSCRGSGLVFTASKTGGSCACPNSSVLLPNITCQVCPKGSTPLTAYECKCPANSVWNSFANKCKKCGTEIPNSAATGGSSMACKCTAGFIWDVMTLTCITTCTSSINGTVNSTTCLMNCILQQAKGNASALNVSTSRAFAGWNITQAALNFAFTNYNAIKGLQCPCATGYVWDYVRLKCMDNNLL